MSRRMRNLLFVALVMASLLACTLPGPLARLGKRADTPIPVTPEATARQLEITKAPTHTAPPAASPTPSPSPGPSPTPMPPTEPVLLSRQPGRGEELQVDAPLVLAFDQAMDKGSVEKAFAIEPAVKGRQEWTTDSMLVFKPDQPWDRESTYRVIIDASAKSREGLPLREEVQFRFATTGYLEVTQVQPAPDAVEVEPGGRITVMFNRPVVPLVAAGQIGDLPDPLVIDPPAKGKGEWLNTAIYAWEPEEGLLPSTEYRVTVSAGLQDTTGGVLAEDYAWSFTTQLPRVLETYPFDEYMYASVTEAISVTFNQPMDRASVEGKFVINGPDGNRVPGTFAWSDQDTVVYLTPQPALPRRTRFVARVDTGALGATGNQGMEGPYIWVFTTVDDPRIVKLSPADGTPDASPYSGVYVKFSAPMDRTTLPDNLTIEYYDPNRKEGGVITPTSVYSYWQNYETEVSLSFAMRASSLFTVTLGGGLADKSGQEIGTSARTRFATRALDPGCYFAMPGRVGTLNAYTTTTAIVGYRNVSRLDFELYSLPPSRFMELAGDDWRAWQNFDKGNLQQVHAWSMPVSPELNKTLVKRVRVLDAEGNVPAPGLYYLEVRSPEMAYTKDLRPAGYVLSISRSNVIIKRTETSAMVWVTDLQTGEPVPGARVTLRTLATQGAEKGSEVTDADGIMTASFQAVDMWAGIFALIERDGAMDAGYTFWEEGITPWDYGLEVRYYGEPYQALLYTDRPLYRPGQIVYFKGILRLDDDARYSLPEPNTEVQVAVDDAQGREVYSDTLQVSDMGTIDGELALDEEAALGYYTLRAQYDESVFYESFRVAEYRKPEYEVEVEADRPYYVHGDTINVTSRATYYFGGPVAGAEVRWAVLGQDYFYRWDGPRWYDWREWEYTAQQGDEPYYAGYGELIAEGTGETDDEGRFTFALPADIADKLNSQVYTLEVTVIDVNEQAVSNRTQAVVHRGLFYIGLAPRRYVGTVGEEQAIDVKVIDLEGEAVANQEAQLVFMERRWYSAQKEGADGRWYWEWEVEDIPVYTTTVRTDAEGEAEALFTPQKGGSYKVRATARDERDNEIRSATYFWVSSDEWISWRRENNDRIELIADKREYRVGDTAEILVPSPFRGPVKALLTVERGEIIDYRVIVLEGNSEIVRVPIVEAYVPNVFVSVALVKGMDESNPLSSFKLGYVALPVSTETKTLNVTLTPDRDMEAGEHYAPRESVRYDVQVTDHTGQGVETELSLDLVDLSVLALTGGDRGVSMIDHFYRERGVGIRTSASLITSIDRVAALLPIEPEGKGGGGGAGLEGEGLIRTRFVDTAYWNPTVRTAADGTASIEVELPDNLTTWRLRGRGVTADTLVGESTVDVLSTLDLLVRTVAPRFFVIGDRATLGIVVHNNTASPLDATVTLEATGLDIEGGPREVTVPAKGKVEVDWPVTALNVDQIVLRAAARGGPRPRGGELSDAVEITLPVYAYSTPEVVATAGQLDAAGERLEAVVLPPSYDPTQGELTVQVDPSLAAGMRDGLTYLEQYPYECVEQTVSRWLPNVLTFKAMRDLGVENAELEENLPGLVGKGLQRIYSEQHYDGGWGWWQFSESDANLSAYVLFGLVKADEAGFAVDRGVIASAVKFLQGQLRGTRGLQNQYEYNQQAFMLYVLAEAETRGVAEAGDLTRTVRLVEERDKLSLYARAYLALALGLLDTPDSPRVKTLLSDFHGAAILSATGAHWEEDEVDYWAMNTDTRSTAIILDALVHLTPEDALLPNVVRWLMVARRAGHWETTQETAWALIALTDYMVATGELEAEYGYSLALNGQEIEERDVTPQDVGQSFKVTVPIADLLQAEANRVWVTRTPLKSGQADAGRLYYAMYLRTFMPVEEVQAMSRGIVVARQYLPVDCAQDETCAPVEGAQAGEVVRVKITLVAPNDLHYLVLEDPLPAGCEAVDRSLATTSIVSEEPQMENVDQEQRWGGYGWGWWFRHTELRDEKVALFADYVPRGTYEYTYLIRASVPGQFLTMPAMAYEMYFPEVWGRSDGGTFRVAE